jgi:hypothetical protein
MTMKKQNDNIQISNVNADTMPSRAVLEAAPVRALCFLNTVGNDPKVAGALGTCGYTDDDRDEGWRLLFAVGGFKPSAAVAAVPVRLQAQQALQSWIATGFRRARVALEHKNPAEAAFVFDGLVYSRGPEAILTIAQFLDRCDELEDGADRKGTRKADHAALATLTRRGIDEAERKRLRALIEICHSTNAAPVVEPAINRTTGLVALHAWVQDWSETARTVITNRTTLIRLGAARRRKATAVVPDPVTPPGTPVSPVTPVAPDAPAPGPAAPGPVVAPVTLPADGGAVANDTQKKSA